MNLEQEWQNMSNEISLQAEKATIQNILIDEASHSLLESLLFKLRWKMRWIRIIDIPLLVLAFFAPGDLQILLLISFLSYEIFRAFAMYEFHKIKTGVDYNNNTKQVLQTNLTAIQKMLRIENIWGYIFLPLSGPMGMLAYSLYKYGQFETAIASPGFLLKILLLALLGIPLFFIARKMNDSIFKAPIRDLEYKIQTLEAEA